MPSRTGSMYVSTISDLGENELYCLAYGHAWHPQDSEQLYDPKHDRVVRVKKLECLRCPKVRTDVYDLHTHEKLGRSHYTEVERSRVQEKLKPGRGKYQAEALRRELNRERFSKAKRFTAS
jgi:tRNA(Ile)-lysidine synthase TilS/MesJ